MKVRVIVDSREPKEIDDLIRSHTPDVERLEMDVGDYRVEVLHDGETSWVPRLIVERKTFKDVIGSLKDGRLWEQHARLVSNAQGAVVAYVIEQSTIPDLQAKTGFMLNKATEAAILKLAVVYRTQLLRSRDLKHTAWMLGWSAKRIGELKDGDDDPTKNYRVVVHASKKLNKTPRESWERMLECVPGVGPEVAKGIAQAFPSLVDFAAAAQRTPSSVTLENLAASALSVRACLLRSTSIWDSVIALLNKGKKQSLCKLLFAYNIYVSSSENGISNRSDELTAASFLFHSSEIV